MRSIGTKTWSNLAGGLALLGAAVGLVGCGDIQPVAPHEQPITDPAQLYMRLVIDHPAVNLSTANGFNTAQLTATPRDASGNAMTGLPAPTFRVAGDTTKVKVTADGLVTAAGATDGINVVAELTAGPVTHVDTAVIKVPTNSPTPPQLATLSLDPVPPDSAIRSVFVADLETGFNWNYLLLTFSGLAQELPTFTPQAISTTGAMIPDLAIEYTSLDPAVATIARRSGLLRAAGPGTVRLVARTMAYGIAKADTATITVTAPIMQTLVAQSGLTGAPIVGQTEIRIAPYGMVVWANKLTDSVDITFDDPTNVMIPPAAVCDVFVAFLGSADPFCGAGNVVMSPNDPLDESLTALIFTTRVRQFPVPGVYAYHSTRTGITGRVVVTDDPIGAAVSTSP